MNLNNEFDIKNLNKQMNYTYFNINDTNNYQFDSSKKNFAYEIANSKGKAKNIPINMKQNNNSKSPNNFVSNKYNNNTFNNFNRINNKNLNQKFINNMQRIPMTGKNFSQKNNNNIMPGKNIKEIQERFDKLQDKINILQNAITNQNPSKDIMQNTKTPNTEHNIDFYSYQPKFNNNTYNTRFQKNVGFNKNNNLGYTKMKDLNEIHNHMQNSNPRDSLIKKMTSYRSTHNDENKTNNNLSKNNFNNIIKNCNNTYNNMNINNNINNNLNRNKRNNMRNIQNNKNNINNNDYHSKINNQSKKNNYIFSQNLKNFNHNNNYKRANLYKFDVDNYPHETGQISDLEDVDINNKTFNFGDSNKFKNEFLLDNSNNYKNINSNKYLNQNDINNISNNNNYTKKINLNNNKKIKLKNNFVNRLSNYNRLSNKNNLMIDNINKNIGIDNNNNKLGEPNILGNNENDEDSSENLSDIAE